MRSWIIQYEIFFFCFLFVIDSIHFTLFITMLFIWHDFCCAAPPFINSGSCYYNLIWVILCFTFAVTWCIALIWRSAKHHVYNRNSMTACHKIAISNLIYFHQYLIIWREMRMFSRSSKCVQLFLQVLLLFFFFFFFFLTLLPLQAHFYPPLSPPSSK